MTIFTKFVSLGVNVVGAPMALTAQVGMLGTIRTGVLGFGALIETGIAFGIEKGINACVFSKESADDADRSWIYKPWVGKTYACIRNGVITFTIANMVTGMNIVGDLPNRPFHSDDAFLVEGALIGVVGTAAIVFAPGVIKGIAKKMTLGFAKQSDEEKQKLIGNESEDKQSIEMDLR